MNKADAFDLIYTVITAEVKLLKKGSNSGTFEQGILHVAEILENLKIEINESSNLQSNMRICPTLETDLGCGE